MSAVFGPADFRRERILVEGGRGKAGRAGRGWKVVCRGWRGGRAIRGGSCRRFRRGGGFWGGRSFGCFGFGVANFYFFGFLIFSFVWKFEFWMVVNFLKIYYFLQILLF